MASRGHQVGLGQTRTVASEPPLRLGVGRHAGRHRQPVMAGRGHHLRVADRDPSHMHRPSPSSRCRSTRRSGNHRTGAALCRYRRRPWAASCPGSAAPPGTATTPARRRTTRLDPARPPGRRRKSHWNHMPGSGTHGRCTRRCRPPHTTSGRRHRPARRALRAPIAHRHQLVVGHVGADLAVRRLHPLLQLGQERVDQLVPAAPTPGSTRPRRGGPPNEPPSWGHSRPAPRHPGNSPSDRMLPESP